MFWDPGGKNDNVISQLKKYVDDDTDPLVELSKLLDSPSKKKKSKKRNVVYERDQYGNRTYPYRGKRSKSTRRKKEVKGWFIFCYRMCVQPSSIFFMLSEFVILILISKDNPICIQFQILPVKLSMYQQYQHLVTMKNLRNKSLIIGCQVFEYFNTLKNFFW